MSTDETEMTLMFKDLEADEHFFLLRSIFSLGASGGSSGENRLTENIHLDFKNIEIIYKDHMKENSKAVNSGSIENRNLLVSSRH